jgi:hypothetical protein
VNYSLLQESGQATKKDLIQEKNNLQSDISNLEQLEDQLTRISEDYETANNICENEIISCVNSIIQSIETAKIHLMQKVRGIKTVNANKVNQNKKDIQSSIQARKKILKAILNSQNFGQSMDSSIYVDMEVLKNVKDIEIKLQKAEFDHIITLLASNVTEELNKNLKVTVENVNFTQGKPLEKQENFLSNQEVIDFRSDNVGRRRRGRGRRGNRRGRNFHPSDNLNEEVKFEVDNGSEISRESYELRGDERRNNRRGHRRPRGRHPVENHFDEPVRDFDPLRLAQNDQRINPHHNDRFFDNETEEEWYIRLGDDLRILPDFVSKQINQNYRNDPIVKIINRGKLVNIANTTLMKYFQIGDDGEAYRSHILVKRTKRVRN